MRDGSTRRLVVPARKAGFEEFLDEYQAKVVVVSGGAVGEEFSLGKDRITLGRGPGVDLMFNDPAMSRQHAVLTYSSDGFRIQDLGSTNGVAVNGKPVQVVEIGHGDRLKFGGHELQLVLLDREETPNTYELEV